MSNHTTATTTLDSPTTTSWLDRPAFREFTIARAPGAPVLTINLNTGEVTGELENMSEAAALFVAAVRQAWEDTK